MEALISWRGGGRDFNSEDTVSGRLFDTLEMQKKRENEVEYHHNYSKLHECVLETARLTFHEQHGLLFVQKITESTVNEAVFEDAAAVMLASFPPKKLPLTSNNHPLHLPNLPKLIASASSSRCQLRKARSSDSDVGDHHSELLIVGSSLTSLKLSASNKSATNRLPNASLNPVDLSYYEPFFSEIFSSSQTINGLPGGNLGVPHRLNFRPVKVAPVLVPRRSSKKSAKFKGSSPCGLVKRTKNAFLRQLRSKPSHHRWTVGLSVKADISDKVREYNDVVNAH